MLLEEYNYDDIITIYIVYRKGDYMGNDIVAWSESKNLALSYTDFHNCKNMNTNKMVGKLGVLTKFINDNMPKRLEIMPITIRSKSKYNNVDYISIPITRIERDIFNNSIGCVMGDIINYSSLEVAFSYLEDKYREAFKMIFLRDAILKAIHNRNNTIIETFRLDELKLLIRLFPDSFGSSI